MKFGDEKWFEELKKRGEFPGTYAFYVGSDKRVSSKVVRSKSGKVSSIQYKTIKPFWENDALVNIKRCETPQDYYEESKRIMGIWEIEPQADETESA